VFGKIIVVSNPAVVRNTAGDLMMRRIIKLQDLRYTSTHNTSSVIFACDDQQYKYQTYISCRGNTMDLSLSGTRALEFDGDAILRIGQKNHIIAIFVGTLMKQLKDGKQFLSGTSACRWYINENDIPEIKAFQRRYTSSLQFIFHVPNISYTIYIEYIP
jgi:replication factor A1